MIRGIFQSTDGGPSPRFPSIQKKPASISAAREKLIFGAAAGPS
jgi:hypothetical protein